MHLGMTSTNQRCVVMTRHEYHHLQNCTIGTGVIWHLTEYQGTFRCVDVELLQKQMRLVYVAYRARYKHGKFLPKLAKLVKEADSAEFFVYPSFIPDVWIHTPKGKPHVA